MKKILTLFTALILFGSMMVVQAVDYYVAHNKVMNSNEWNASGDKMTQVGSSNIYSITFNGVSTSEVQFKVTEGSWTTNYGSENVNQMLSNIALYDNGGNACFKLANSADVTIYFDAAINKIYVRAAITDYHFSSGTTIYYDFTGYGSGINIYDGTWYSNTNSIISIDLASDWYVSADINLFKSNASSWNFVKCTTLPTSGQNMIVSTDGATYHWDTYVPAGPIAPPTITLHGNFSGNWETSADFDIAAGDETASLTLNIAAGNYEFGVYKGAAWVANSAAFSRANASNVVSGDAGNCTLEADVTGDYTFTWTYATNTLEITYPAIPAQNVSITGLASQILKGSVVNFTASSSGIDEPGYRFYVKEKNGSFGSAVTSYTFDAVGEYVVKVEALEYNTGDPVATDESNVVIYDTYTFTAGTTIYVDFSAMTEGSKKVNYPKNNEVGIDYDENGAGTIKTITFTTDVTWTTLADAFIKTEKAGWAALKFSVPGTGQNHVIVAADGASYSWGTYVMEPEAFVAGSEADIFGTAWTAGLSANQMTWDEGMAKYAKVYTVDKAYKSVGLKVVYDNVWYGENGGSENVKFSLSGPGEFVVYFNKATYHVTVGGPIVGEEQFDFEYAAVAANGEGNWAHGENWNAATTTNRMTEVAANVWEISFDNVPAKDCQLKFCFDGAWNHEFGGTFSAFGTASPAVYGNSASTINFSSTAGSIITIRLDLSNFNFATKEGATFTVSQVEPIAPIGGKFIINANADTVVFSRGNLCYNYGLDTWYCSEKQYDVLAETNLNFGKPGYTGSIDLFSWSNSLSDFGRLTSNKDADYLNGGAFIDWGSKFPGETAWCTLSKDEWDYLFAHHQWTMINLTDAEAADEDVFFALVLFPYDWVAPAGLENLRYKFYALEDDAKLSDNTFTLAQWHSLFEPNGAVLLPTGGSRAGYYGNTIGFDGATEEPNPARWSSEDAKYDHVDNVAWLGYYWLSSPHPTEDKHAAYVILPGEYEYPAGSDDWHSTIPAVWHREKRRGNSVRLVARHPRQEVTIRDGLNAGKWGTLCPKQNVEFANGATFYQISYLEENGGMPYIMYFDQISGNTLTAGQPYFFIANATEIRGTKTGAELDAAGAGVNGFYGWISATDESKALSWKADYDPTGDNTYVIYGNMVTRINGATSLKSERCYINISPSEPSRSGSAPVPGRARFMINVDGHNTPTGMDQITNDQLQMSNKVIINDHLYILRGEKMYDATGRLVK